MNPTIIGGLIKRGYNDFNISQFNDRLKFQKFIYLLQECGLNLGYQFRLHLHGPYCTLLTRDGFDMPKIDECKEVSFEDAEKEKVFEKFLDFIEPYKENPDQMEILASLILFKRLNKNQKDNFVINLVKRKDIKFHDKEDEIQNLLNKIKEFGELNW